MANSLELINFDSALFTEVMLPVLIKTTPYCTVKSKASVDSDYNMSLACLRSSLRVFKAKDAIKGLYMEFKCQRICKHRFSKGIMGNSISYFDPIAFLGIFIFTCH